MRVAGNLTLQDISREGRLLVTRDTSRTEMLALAPGETKERDLTWLDWSLPSGISPDGGVVLFSESGEGGGAGYSVYIRKTDGSPAVRLGEGNRLRPSLRTESGRSRSRNASDPQLRHIRRVLENRRSFRAMVSLSWTASGCPTASRFSSRRASQGTGRGSTCVTSTAARRAP